MRHADLTRTEGGAYCSAAEHLNREAQQEAELHTSCWLQTARSDTLPQPTGTVSKQRSGSQPNTRRESEAPLKTQEPSGLKRRHLTGRGLVRVQESKVTWSHVNKPHLTAEVSPSNVPIIVNFSRSQSLMLLRQNNVTTHTVSNKHKHKCSNS